MEKNKIHLEKIKKLLEKRYKFFKENYIYINMFCYLNFLKKFYVELNEYQINEKCINYLNYLKKKEIREIRNFKRAIKRIKF